ncbi:uncharacterized protein LOC122723081 [Manihot esculenta]|uniref:uncharacterized protein LOC122723081 n=1 Tax=Manihot esculenta TaxID=3983 RepID=UPI001CC6E284|nr:uncharacterized protein LOC122723081 [Manihot esculenta]
MIDAASGGAISEMEPEEGKTLISKMIANSRQYGQEEDISRNANEVSIASLDSKISQLTATIQQLAVGNNARTCGICKQADHPIDMCPILQEGKQQVNAIGGFNDQQRKYDPFSSTYNPGWRGHPNLSYGNRQQKFQPRANYQTGNLVSKLESQGKLPFQTIPNLKQNVSAITLRSGKELDSASSKKLAQGSKADQKTEVEMEILEEKQPQKSEEEQSPMQVIRPPFPERFAQSKREKEEKEILEIFRKVQVNISLLETIKQIPRYAKFLKDLCTNKRKLYGYEKIKVGENVSAVLQRKIAQKCKDKVYLSLDASPLKQTGVTLQLADRSIVYPKGVLEDVLVQVGRLIFPADFFVLDMEDNNSSNYIDLLLGRPFLSTARTKIDVHEGTLSMEFDGEEIGFSRQFETLGNLFGGWPHQQRRRDPRHRRFNQSPPDDAEGPIKRDLPHRTQPSRKPPCWSAPSSLVAAPSVRSSSPATTSLAPTPPPLPPSTPRRLQPHASFYR